LAYCEGSAHQQEGLMWNERRGFLTSIGASVAGGAVLPLFVSEAMPLDAVGQRSDSPAPQARESELPALPEGWWIISYAVLDDGSLCMLGANINLQHEWRRAPSGTLLGDPFARAAGALAGFWIFDGENLAAGPTFPLLRPSLQFDRFPDGRWLVASARSDDADSRILSADGSELGRIRLGDGIMHLKIDDASRIWVGWFDEGVFGNDGWRVPGLEWPPSAYGLAAFDASGRVIVQAKGAPAGSEIADCYALNVVGGQPWACTYPEFPVSTYEAENGWRWRSTGLSGTRALAVRPPYILAAGGYGEDDDQVVLVRLDEEQGVSLGRWRLPFPVGFPARADFVDARGDELHVVWDGVWSRWRIGDFLAAGAHLDLSSA